MPQNDTEESSIYNFNSIELKNKVIAHYEYLDLIMVIREIVHLTIIKKQLVERNHLGLKRNQTSY